ncbi:endonuclease [Winogradskyella eckloniae]|uniref:endonuclease n=1 Tax=Winogradskyella eckloniae TaxID=1089306 RepID=UPI0019D68190|nr:endonuclease [Winogradskyella eckloniae]
MKKLLLLFFAIPLIGIAQIPSYYNDVDLTLSGLSLKDELAVKVISTHSSYLTYTPGVWDALKQTDLDPNDNSKVLMIYGYDDNDGDSKTDRTRGVNDNGGSVGDWNREHVFPKSLGSPNLGTSGPGADAHHLRPCDTQWNSTRNNRKFTDGSGDASIVGAFWYPGDEWKGDVARMMMYMYLRYGSQCLPINVGEGTSVSIDANMIDLFLQWNVDDPVSAFEEQRNPILENLQGNRNPFIDNPAFATEIWGGPQAEDKFGSSSSDTQAPTAPSNLVVSNATTTTLDLTWGASTDNVGVVSYNIYEGGAYLDTSANTSYTVNSLASNTTYSYTVYALDSAGNVSLVSNSASGTTLSAGTGSSASELFISEYVEGSSYNKAIELANFTGASIDLSSYDLRRNTNGGSSWGTALSLSGSVIDGDVYVVSHSSAASAVTTEADLTTTASAMIFNGNDPVGLFKNGVLIDIVGVFNNGSSNFAKDTTLRRINSVTDPTTTYNTAEWDSYSSNTFDGIGSHTIDGGTTVDTIAPTTVENIIVYNETETTLDISWDASIDNVGVVSYNLYLNGVLNTMTANTSIQVTGLSVDTSYSIVVNAIDASGNVSSDSVLIYGQTVDLTAPSTPSSLVVSNATTSSLDLSWVASTDNVGVIIYEIYEDGAYLDSSSNTSYSAASLASNTTYSYVVYALDAAGNISLVSNSASGTTLSSGSGSSASELFISEYVEGSSYNKAIEIANFTGASIDLSSYDLRRNTNGGSSWGTALSLSGNVLDGDVYVVAHSSASSAVTTEADLTTSASAMIFNGNDPVGLFKNGVLIDIVGEFNNSSNFGKNTTLRRISSVTEPTTTYNTAEWDSYSSNTFSDLGVHTISSSSAREAVAEVENIKLEPELTALLEVRLFPNPVNSKLNIEVNNANVTYSIYSSLGREILKGDLIAGQLNVSYLEPGMYMIMISDGKNVVTERFIKK